MRADFHIHSTVSDGSFSIEKIIKTAKEKKLTHIAITDHDTLAHSKKIPQNSGIKIIVGIELSAMDKENGKKAHVLGFNIKDNQMVEDFAKPILEKRHQNSLKQIEILQQNGYEIDIEKIKKADDKYIYKQHIVDYLATTKQIDDMFGVFYNKTFKNGGICHFDIEYLDVKKAVDIIKKAGGKAVLAHPGQQQNFYLLDKISFDGVEINHLKNSVEDKKIIRAYAQKYNLFLTGGSDFHGVYEKEKNDIGDNISEESGVLALC